MFLKRGDVQTTTLKSTTANTAMIADDTVAPEEEGNGYATMSGMIELRIAC